MGELIALRRWSDMETVKMPAHIVDVFVEHDLVD